MYRGLIFIGVFAWVMGISPPAPLAEGPLNTVVSILPQRYFVEKIGGDLVNVSVMVEPGVDPHVYDPRPQQMVALTHAEIYFAIGVPFENAWLPRFAATNPRMTIVHTEEGIQRIPIETGDGDAGGESPRSDAAGDAHRHGSGDDPHLWLSPPLVMLQARNILNALVSADPGNASTYRSNYKGFITEILDLDLDLMNLFSGREGGRAFMVFHPSWGYFARAYGLKQVPVEVEGKEPKGPDLQRLIKYAREHGIKVVFVQPQFSTTSAEVISKEIGGQVISVDPLAPDWTRNLREVGERFRKVLK